MQDKNKVPITSAEIAALWTSYMSDSMAACVLKYFLDKAEDEDVKPHLNSALLTAEHHVESITNFFNMEGIPVPQGFIPMPLPSITCAICMPSAWLDTLYH